MARDDSGEDGGCHRTQTLGLGASALEAIEAMLEGAEDTTLYRLKRHRDGRNEALWISRTVENVVGLPRELLMRDFGAWMERIEPDDLPRIAEAEAEARKTGERQAVDLRARIDGEDRLLRLSFLLRPQEDGSVLFDGTLRDMTRRLDGNSERERLLATMDEAHDLIAMAAPDGRLTYQNAAARRVLAIPDDVSSQSLNIADLHDGEESRRVLADVLPVVAREGMWSGRTVLRALDGREVPVDATIMRHTDAKGATVRFSTIMRDVREREALERELRLVNQELNHRIKNLFAVMQALVTMTSREESDVAGLATRLRSRMQALSAAHLLSTETETGGAALRPVPLEQLLRSILAPYERGPANLELAGPAVAIPTSMLTSIGLIVHELATNAVKYGGWTGEDGMVDVSWTFGEANDDGSRRVDLRWIESPVDREAALVRAGGEPSRGGGSGFGARLLLLSAQQLGGTLTQAFDGDAFVSALSFPVHAVRPR